MRAKAQAILEAFFEMAANLFFGEDGDNGECEYVDDRPGDY